MTRTWKPVVGYEGIYEVSSDGLIKSLARKKINGQFTHIKKEKILKPCHSSTGYVKYSLVKNGKINQSSAHRIVAEAFIPNINNKPQINHMDGNKKNNHISNLEWVTASENTKHCYSELMDHPMIGRYGKDNNKSRAVVQIYNNGEETIWLSASDAVREIGADSSCISRCCQGKSKTHHGYRWRYYE